MKSAAPLALALLLSLPLGLGPRPVAAEVTSRTIYQQQSWKVRVVNFDNKRLSCVAQVSRSGNIFSIWANRDSEVRLQFYSRDWAFGQRHRGDLRVRIDTYPSWRMTNAELYKHSVLFDLPSSSKGTKFLLEVARGQTLRLYNSRGKHVRSYTLSGSQASIKALIRCVKALRGGGAGSGGGGGGGGSNPFD